MKSNGEHLRAIRAAWRDLVGPESADQSRPIEIVEGALIIATSTPITIRLARLETQLIEKLGGIVPEAAITRLRIRPTPEDVRA